MRIIQHRIRMAFFVEGNEITAHAVWKDDGDELVAVGRSSNSDSQKPLDRQFRIF